MNTNRIRTAAGRLAVTGLLFALAGCGGGGADNGPDCRYDADWINGRCKVNFDLPPIVIPDGIFRGTDPRGQAVTALISRFSEVRYIDGDGRVGSGRISVGTNNAFGSAIQLVTAYGDSFSDGSTSAGCLLSGTVVEKKSITGRKACTTDKGLAFDEPLNLTFDPLYNRSSSMGIVAGLYQMPSGDIMRVGLDGAIFSQSGTTGCVMTGFVTLVASSANLYEVLYEIENCVAEGAVWNGSGFEGLAVVDNRNTREVFLMAVVGQVDGNAVSIVAENPKL